MSRYELRVLLASWGLVVDVEMTVHVADIEPPGAVAVRQGVWLVVAPSADVWEIEMIHLVRGVHRVAPRFAASLTQGREILVFVVNHLWFPLTDSQDDAIELAVAGWAAEELGILSPPASVSFNRTENRYDISFDETLWQEL